MRFLFAGSSELQSCFSGGVGHRGNSTVVAVAAAVEHHRIDTSGLGPLTDERADLLRGFDAAGERYERPGRATDEGLLLDLLRELSVAR